MPADGSRSSGGAGLELFAVTAPGLEPLVAAELRGLGIRGRTERGGVSWSGDLRDVYSANLHLRTATRVVARLARFRARGFGELERHLKRVGWTELITPGRPVRLRVSSGKSRLYHEGAIAERFARILGDRLGSAAAMGRDADDDRAEDEAEEQLLVVRFHRDECLVSADSSGALLHRRGYRQAVAKAPLRETLAAGMLLASGWDGSAALLDPFCGSGTIPIEAALLARRVPPGLANPAHAPRGYAFELWPSFDATLWERVITEARAAIEPRASIPILGSDRDVGAIEAAAANARRAGVDGDLSLAVRPLSSVEPAAAPGWVVTNPPYGLRVGDRRPLRDLYAALGKLARTKLAGWRIVLLTADEGLDRQTGLTFEELLRTRNGGIDVRLLVSR